MGNLSNLEFLHLSDNEFSGALPAWLGNLSNLELLSLGGNAFSGVLPSSLVNLTNLERLYLENTQLCAPTDAAFQSWLEGIDDKRGVVNCQEAAPESDRAALVALYEATNGANWRDNTHWLSDRPLDEWVGVTTDGEGRVNSLWLRGLNQLSGSIPSEVGNLSNLEFLILIGEFSGSIPSSLGNLSNLEFLVLGGGFSGSIPSSLGNLSNLEFLELHGDFSGGIPSSLGNLSNLETLNLATNQLSGSIPSSLGNLSNLETLNLFHNPSLSGPLPHSFTRLGNLSFLDVRLTGLCAPGDATFQAWIEGIEDKEGVVNCP